MMKTIVISLILIFLLPSFGETAPRKDVKFDVFAAMIGLDDGCIGRAGESIFSVLLDGEEAFKSHIMLPGETPMYIAIPLGDAKKLTLIVDDEGDGHGGDWGNWADARLIDNDTGAVFFLSDMNEVVEQQWIDTKKDRNIIEEPLKMSGKIYAKGLGAISGSKMSYSGWNELFNAKRAKTLEENRQALRRFGQLTIAGNTQGAGIIHGEESFAKGNIDLCLLENSSIVVTFGTEPGKSVMEHPVFQSVKLTHRRNRSGVPLGDFVPSKIEHIIPPTGPLPESDEVILNGKRYFGAMGTGHTVIVYYDDLPAQTLLMDNLTPPSGRSARTGIRLLSVIGIESPEKHPFATAVFMVTLDGKPVYRSGLITSFSEPEILDIPVDRAKDLVLSVYDFGDGRYHDSAVWADIALVEPAPARRRSGVVPPSRQFMLTSFIPYFSKSGFRSIGINSSSYGGILRTRQRRHESGLGTWAPSEIYFKDIQSLITKRSEAMDEISKAVSIIEQNRDILEAESHVFRAKLLDKTLTDIYPILGKIEERKGDIQAAIDAWERVIDICDSTAREKRVAKNVIDRLYEKGGFLPSEKNPKNQPPLLEHGINIGRHEGAILTVPVGTVHEIRPGSEVLLPGRFVIEVDPEHAGKHIRLVVNSRGLKPVLRIASLADTRNKPVAEYESYSSPVAKKDDCIYEWELEEGSWVIFVDYSRENAFDNTCSFYLAYSLSDEPHHPTSESWKYNISTDGTVDVECTVEGIAMLIVPHTAEEPVVRGGNSYICHPLHEYGSKLNHPYNLGRILMVTPHDGRAVVSFRWLDGAYNVPMTIYGKDRKDAFYFESIPGINPASENISVSVVLPEDTGDILLSIPDGDPPEGQTYSRVVPYNKTVRIHSKHASLDTKWLAEPHRVMTVYIPDNPHNKRWLPEYMEMLKRIYDRESYLMGDYEPDKETFVYLTGPAQLSGYGGATWGGKNSETWIASTGRIGEYHLRHQFGGSGVEAHELKWVFLSGTVKAIPRWLLMGTIIWLEEQGKYAGNLAFPDYWTWTELKRQSRRHLDLFTCPGTGYARLEEDDFKKLSNDEKRMGDAMTWYICQWLHDRYGDEFWREFWIMQRKDPDAYINLDPRARTIKAVEDMVTVSKDPRLKKQFESWGFDLSPDPQYSAKYFFRLPDTWRFTTGDDPEWAKPDFDHSEWNKISVSERWESVPEYASYDGFAWYRMEFEFPKQFRRENLVLDLGKVDDCDEVFFNGEKIGATGSMPPDYRTDYTAHRKYEIPAGLIRTDDVNVIAVRVYDGGGGGGIYDAIPGIMSQIKK